MKDANARSSRNATRLWALPVAAGAAAMLVGLASQRTVQARAADPAADRRPDGAPAPSDRGMTHRAGRMIDATVMRIAQAAQLGGRTDGRGSRIVHSTQELDAALRSARAGESILLAPGTYSDISIDNLRFDGVVDVGSSDPKNPAVLTHLMVVKSKGLRFHNLELSTVGQTEPNPFRVVESDDIHFVQLSVHGTLNDDTADAIAAMILRNSTNISVEDSEFQQLKIGIAHRDCDHLVISRNNFHDIRVDGIHGGGSSNVLISDNHFTDFFNIHDKAHDHPDAIQFWTTNTTESAHDITVTGNVAKRGKGTYVQGVFFRDEKEAHPFQNVIISHNTIIGEANNGIMVDGARNVQIIDNTIQPFPDRLSRLRLQKVDNVTVANNTAGKFVYKDVTGLKESSNKLAGGGGRDVKDPGDE